MKNATLSIAVLSGKGGVGKSNIALNLSYALHRLNNNALIIDCDMGLANMDILLGISPDLYIQDIFLKNTPPEKILYNLEKTTSGLGTKFLDLLPANSGVSKLSELDATTCGLLIEKINPLAKAYDILMLDIGAGISPMVMNFSSRTQIRILVITPEPTSLADGYATMKILATNHDIHSFHIVVNQVESSSEALHSYERLATVCDKFLGFCPEYLGEIRSDKALAESVIKQKPLMVNAPRSAAAMDFSTIAKKLHSLRSQALLSTINNALPLKVLESDPVIFE